MGNVIASMYLGHISLFLIARSLFVWYKLVCIDDLSYRLIWIKSANMLIHIKFVVYRNCLQNVLWFEYRTTLLSYMMIWEFPPNTNDSMQGYFQRYWPLVRGIHRSPVNSPHKGQWRATLVFSLICAWINGWVSNREAGDLRRYRVHCCVTVMIFISCFFFETESIAIGSDVESSGMLAFDIDVW